MATPNPMPVPQPMPPWPTAPRPKGAGLCPDCGDIRGDGCRCAELLAEAAAAPAYGRVRLADVQAAMTALATTTGGTSQ